MEQKKLENFLFHVVWFATNHKLYSKIIRVPFLMCVFFLTECVIPVFMVFLMQKFENDKQGGILKMEGLPKGKEARYVLQCKGGCKLFYQEITGRP